MIKYIDTSSQGEAQRAMDTIYRWLDANAKGHAYDAGNCFKRDQTGHIVYGLICPLSTCDLCKFRAIRAGLLPDETLCPFCLDG